MGHHTEVITSVGIDIGTTTTQLVISRLTMANRAAATAVPRIEIVAKEVLYKSRIYFTPLLDHQHIDAEAIARIVAGEYQAAGLTMGDIDTGAVIITGETAKKENARAIVEALADLAGDFVVATAGPNLESILAGKGSGAAAFSQAQHRVTANIDIGGGTSNFAVFKDGRAIDTACLNIGGRLVELERHGDRITYISEPGRVVLRECGLTLGVGDRISLPQLKLLAQAMARCVLEAVTTRNLSNLARELLMTPPLRLDYPIQTVMVSGGVADHIYSSEQPVALSGISTFGDMGPALGWAIRDTFRAAGVELTMPRETIRATVIGAGTQSVNVSGSTIYLRDHTLPVRNCMVITPFPDGLPDNPGDIADVVQQAVFRATSGNIDQPIALALDGPRTPSFADIEHLATGLAAGLAGYLREGKPLVIVVAQDCAKVLGQCLETRLARAELICIDQIRVDEGDYIDIGKPLMGGRVVPVVVKTLVFPGPS